MSNAIIITDAMRQAAQAAAAAEGVHVSDYLTDVILAAGLRSHAKTTECVSLQRAIVEAADRHAIYHTLRPMDSVLAEVLEAERRAGWAEGVPD